MKPEWMTLNENYCILIKISVKFVLKVQTKKNHYIGLLVVVLLKNITYREQY